MSTSSKGSNVSSKPLSRVEVELKEERQKNAKRKRQNLELLSMKRPTTVDDVRSRVPLPRNPLPCNALPEWRDRPLNSKLPAVPAPDGTFYISQGHIGRKIFVGKPNQEFDTSDPLIQETPIEYHSLHDPNLKEYFQTNPVVCKRLVDLGLVTCEGDVIAGLSEYNKYRQYLSRIHNQSVNKLKQEAENWEHTERENIKAVTRYLKNALQHQVEEEKKKKRDKNLHDLAEKNRVRKLKALEHPSNFLKEKRLIEARIRKIKRDALHKNVMDRLKRLRDSEKRRARHMLLNWICKDEFREKLRCVIKLEKEVNKQQDLCEFVETKRAFQEKKQKYHKALLRRQQIENECKVVNRYEGYLNKRIEDDKRAVENKKRAQERAERRRYLMEKYGRRWLNLCRKYTGNPLHTSAWHVRNILHGLVQHVKFESGAKNFNEYIKDIMNKSKRNEVSAETKSAVNSILDTLVERSYKQFIDRATTCLVDYVVDEARKKYWNQMCEQGINPSDLEVPVVPKRKKKNIVLPKPTFPLDGPCADYLRTGNWPCSCSQQLQNLHGELCVNLLKKLKKCIKRAMRSCGERGSLDRLESRARKARGSPLVCGAIEAAANILLGRTCEGIICDGADDVDNICRDLCACLLGPDNASPCGRKKPCGGGRRGRGPCGKTGKGKKSPGRGPKKEKEKAQASADTQAQGMGPTGLAQGGEGAEEGKGETAASEFFTSDSEADGAPVAPAGTGVGPGRTKGQGTQGTGPGQASQGVGDTKPAQVSRSTEGVSVSEQGTQKTKPTGAEASTGRPGGDKDQGTAGGVPVADSGTGGAGPTTADRGEDGKAMADQAVDKGPEAALADAGVGKDKGGDGETQASGPPGTDAAVSQRPSADDKSVGEPKSTDEKGLGEPGAKTSDAGAGAESGTDAETMETGPTTSDDGSGKPPGKDGSTEGSAPRNSDAGTEGKRSQDESATADGEPSVEAGTGPPGAKDEETSKEPEASQARASATESTGSDKGTGSGRPSGTDGAVGTEPGKDKDSAATEEPGKDQGTGKERGSDAATAGDPTQVDDKGSGRGSGAEKGADATGEPGKDAEAGPEKGQDRASVASSGPGDERGTAPEPGAEESTEAKPTPGDEKGAGPDEGPDKGTETGPDEPGAEAGTGTEDQRGSKGSEPGDEKGTSPEEGPEKSSEAVPGAGDEKGTGPEEGPEKGTEAKPEPGRDSAVGSEPGKEGETQAESAAGTEEGAGTEPGADKSTKTTPKTSTDDGTGPETGKDEGDGTEQAAGVESEAGTEPGEEKGTEQEGVPKDEKATDSKPGEDEKGTESEAVPGKDEDAGTEEGPEKGTEADATTAEDKSTVSEPGKEDGTEAKPPEGEGKETEPVPGEDKDTEATTEPAADKETEAGKEPGTDQETEAGKEPGTDKDTEPEPGKDKDTEAAKEPGKDQDTEAGKEPGQEEGTGPEAAVAGETETDKVTGEDKGDETVKPTSEEQQTGVPVQDEGTEKPGDATDETGAGVDKQDEETGKGPEATAADGTETDKGESKETESEEGKPGESVGTDKPADDKGTEGEPREPGVEEGMGADDTRDQGVDAKGAEEWVIPSGIDGPCICTEIQPCGDTWADQVMGEDYLLANIDLMLEDISSQMVRECIEKGGRLLASDEQDQTEVNVGSSLSAEIDKLIQGELSSLEDSEAAKELRARCAKLSNQERDKCLEEAMKQLQAQCQALSPADQGKCMAEVNRFLGTRSGDGMGEGERSRPSDEEISRTASCVVDSVLREQTQFMIRECEPRSGGDEAGKCGLSEENVSRIASTIVKQSLECPKLDEQPKCPPIDPCCDPAVGTSSQAVQGSVRERLLHIRSILDEVKSDLAEVGIHPTFSETEQQQRRISKDNQGGS